MRCPAPRGTTLPYSWSDDPSRLPEDVRAEYAGKLADRETAPRLRRVPRGRHPRPAARRRRPRHPPHHLSHPCPVERHRSHQRLVRPRQIWRAWATAKQRPGRCPRRCPCLRARSRGRVLEILDQAVASADQAPACVVVGPIPGLPARVTRLGCVMWETRNLWPPTEARWTSCWGISAKMRDPSDRLTAESAELVYTFGRVVVNLSRMEPTSWAGPGPPRPPHRVPHRFPR